MAKIDYSKIPERMGFSGPYYDTGPDDKVYLVLSESTCLELRRSDGRELTPADFRDLDSLLSRPGGGASQ